MPSATVTVRELKNKDTGLDLSVTTYKNVKAMIGSTYEYHVTVVSNLSYFKSAKHKETDNVQFVIPRKLNEFEELHSKLNAKYSGTALPALPKKVLMVNDTVARERRNTLDNLVHFIAKTPKLCNSSLVLEFLGVNPVKAGKFRTMEVSDASVSKADKGEAESSSATDTTTVTQEENNDPPPDLFDEPDEEDDDADLFGGDTGNQATGTDDTKLFDDPDLGGGLQEGEGDDLFLVDAVPEPTKQTAPQPDTTEEEEDTDLFQINEDLDEIMTLDFKSKAKEEVDVKKTEEVEEISQIPSETDIPAPKTEAVAAARPKPAPRTKRPGSATSASDTKQEEPLVEKDKEKSQSEPSTQRPVPAPRQKPPVKQKPDIGQKPSVPSKKPSVPTKKPNVPTEKPSVPTEKPNVPTDKPSVPAEKPNVPTEKPSVPTEEPSIPVDKPSVTAGKPDMSPKPSLSQDKEPVKPVDTIGEDDILKYIQENAAQDEDDIDLFS